MSVTTTITERFSPRQRLGLSALACTLTAVLAAPLSGRLDLANMVMLFLLTVLLVAVSLGRNPAVLAALLSVVLFDVFFVPPRFSLAVSNLQYLITFAVMLATALITGHLTASLRQQALDAGTRERRTHALYEIARKLAGAMSDAQVSEIIGQFVKTEMKGEVYLQLNASVRPDQAPPGNWFNQELAGKAHDSSQTQQNAQTDSITRAALYLPLKAPMQVRGVLAVQFGESPDKPVAENIALLEAIASLAGIAVERLHYAEIAQTTELKMATERLRSSILSALSHDLRTPLTVLVGLADSLCLVKPPLSAGALETAETLREQASRMAGLLTNLLEMARLNAGSVSLRQQWQPLEEIVGSSLKLLGTALGNHRIQVALPADLPLLYFDSVLIERVLCNLLENAAKYATAQSEIGITARLLEHFVEISVCDQGQGFPPTENNQLFEMFTRGQSESEKPGVGLGLAICRAIVDVHGGNIHLENLPQGGACITFSLPRGTPPVLEAEVA